MAKKNSTLSFKDAYIDVKENTITEVTRDGAYEHNLMETLESLEGACLNISFKENIFVLPPDKSEE